MPSENTVSSQSNSASPRGWWPRACPASRSRGCIAWKAAIRQRCLGRSPICGCRPRPSDVVPSSWRAASRREGMAFGCNDCCPPTASRPTCSSQPASLSIVVHAGPRRTGSTPRACCACSPRGWRAIGRCVAMVRVPTPDEEDAKRPHREREHLVQQRLRIENRIEALLFTQGIRGRPSLRSWERDVAALRTGDGRDLPPLLRTELDRLRRRLVLVLELTRELETDRAQALEAKAADTIVGKITALKRIRGIGENFAAVLAREVFYRSFGNRPSRRDDSCPPGRCAAAHPGTQQRAAYPVHGQHVRPGAAEGSGRRWAVQLRHAVRAGEAGPRRRA